MSMMTIMSLALLVLPLSLELLCLATALTTPGSTLVNMFGTH